MLKLRRRGKVWHVRGTIRTGRQSVRIEESTGCTDRASAERYAARIESDAREAALGGRSVAARLTTFEDAAITFLKSRPVQSSDRSAIRRLREHFGGWRMSDIDNAAFAAFRREHLPGRSPATAERVRITLLMMARAAGLELRLSSVGQSPTRIRFLSHNEADRLCDSYLPHVKPMALVARYGGLRAGELLRLERRDLDLSRGPHGSLLVRESKSGLPRTVPLHPRAQEAIAELLECRNPKPHDPLFLNRVGLPYADTRGIGGNPLTKAHAAACRAAGIEDFRWHDWRHHFATWALRPIDEGGAGLDLPTLMLIGGWSTLSSVQKYAAPNHAAAAGDRLSRIA